MDTAITKIGGVVLGEFRSAGYMGSAIGQYEKTIRALTGYARRHGTTGFEGEASLGKERLDKGRPVLYALKPVPVAIKMLPASFVAAAFRAG